jgi:hypothetical protein
LAYYLRMNTNQPTDDDLIASYLREFDDMQRCTVIQWDDGTEFVLWY